MLIAVAGNVGSGKTTLAKYLSEKYFFHYIPQRRFEFDFIDDFFNDIEGKFFPAQVAFLLSKAIEIQDLIGLQENIVVDRSLLEDIQVFARLWIENRNIDKKIIQLYHHTADFIRSAIPNPDLYIVCKCSAKVSAQRISQRSKRNFEKHYPPNHIQQLEEYYSDLTFGAGVPYVEIDTEKHDFTNPDVMQFICEQIFSHIENWHTYDQMSLFESPRDQEIISGVSFINFNENNRPTVFTKKAKYEEYVYLAAPFSQFATEKKTVIHENGKDYSLFSDLIEEKKYGALPARYRKRLTQIARSIEKYCGMPILLPHRDINNWGSTPYDSHYLTPRIIKAVEHATALVAIPGSSIGVHLEIGVAIAKGIPIVIFDTQDLSSSFFVEGFENLSNVKYYKIKSTSVITKILEEEEDISDFIRKKRGTFE